MQGRVYSLAKRLKIGRLLRYGDLWARYLWRRGLAAADGYRANRPFGEAAALGADLAAADMASAKRMVVASWFPLDLTNAGLHRAMLESVLETRPDLGVTAEILDCTFRLKRADDLSACVPPEAPGLYPIRLFATLDTGARLEARGLLTVIGHKGT